MIWSVAELVVNRSVRRCGLYDVHVQVGNHDVRVRDLVEQWAEQGGDEFLARAACWGPSWDAAIGVFDYLGDVIRYLSVVCIQLLRTALGVAMVALDHDRRHSPRDEAPPPVLTPRSFLTPITTDGPPRRPVLGSVRRGVLAA